MHQAEEIIDKSLFEINFDDLAIECEIGHGGSGTIVYKAKYLNSQTVAIKMFRKNFEQSYQEFLHEMKLLNSLRHANIVRYV